MKGTDPHMSLYFLDVEIVCPPATEKIEKLVNWNLSNISSYRRLTGAAAKPGSSLLNHLRNKMYL